MSFNAGLDFRATIGVQVQSVETFAIPVTTMMIEPWFYRNGKVGWVVTGVKIAFELLEPRWMHYSNIQQLQMLSGRQYPHVPPPTQLVCNVVW